MRQFYVYILSSRSGVLYAGVTSDLERRLYEHQHELIDGFTKKYGIKRLIYSEVFDEPLTAIDREKQNKRWRRSKKLALIRTLNPRSKSSAWMKVYESVLVTARRCSPARRRRRAIPPFRSG
jgi:putative endonuclease